MTQAQAERLCSYIDQYTKAAMKWNAARPGTQTKRALEKIMDRAESKLNALIYSLINEY